MSNIYVNHTLPAFDEARYQTISRGHGFAELNGVSFKIADKYDVLSGQAEISHMIQNLRISTSSTALAEAAAYTFALEEKVLENLVMNGS